MVAVARQAKRQKKPALQAFSIDHAARVTRLTRTRLKRWDRLGLFSPEYLDEQDRGNAYARIYSFEDLVGLRTLGVLSDKYHVPISEIRAAYAKLSAQWSKPWSQIDLAVLKRKIVTDLKGQPRNVTDGQLALKHIPLPSIAEEVRREADKLRKREPSDIGKFEQNKFVVRNTLVFSGTRIPVSAIEEFLDEGYSDAAIVAEYPSLTVKDIKAVRSTRLAA